MRLLLKLLVLSFFPIFVHAQQGKIIQVPVEQKTGAPLYFLYTPPAGLQIPEDAGVKVNYMPYAQKKAPLEKDGNGLGFELTLPDTTGIFFAVIIDGKNKVIDNNAGKGYRVALQKNQPILSAANKVAPMQLAWFGNFSLELKNSPREIISDYEQLYAANPELKSGESFFDYVLLKKQEDPENGQTLLLEFAKENENKNDEQAMKFAMYAYSNLKMQEDADRQKEKILNKFPKGDLAKGAFRNQLYELNPKTEEAILALMKEYETFFQDSSVDNRNTFYVEIIRASMAQHAWAKLDKYEKLLVEPLRATSFYNNYAWEMSGGDLTSPGKNLKEAEKLMVRAMAIAETRLKKPNPEDDIESLQGTYNNLKDTYALILYKLGRYNEAFTQQNYVDSLGGLDAGGKERMAAYTEKSMGAENARLYIEKALAGGTYSVVLLKQLEQLYRQLNLSMQSFAAIKQKTDSIGIARAKEAIIAIYGTEEAIDFTLPDAGGKMVSLAGQKGKMVVLDFWATWCGPCLASFPKMQELVAKYDGDKATFLFINTWENDKPEVTREKVDKLLKEKKYAFNVLYDHKDEVVKQYKIEGIPTKIVIDKEGKIVSIDSTDDALAALIEAGSGN